MNIRAQGSGAPSFSCFPVTIWIHFFVQIMFCCLSLVLMKYCRLACSVQKPVGKFMHYPWKCASNSELLFWVVSAPREIRTPLKITNPKQYSSWKCSHMSLWLFLIPKFRFLSVFLRSFSLKCHLLLFIKAKLVMCACLQFLQSQSSVTRMITLI